MSMPPENGDDDINGEDENTVLIWATQTLDLLALHLPPEILITHLVRESLNLVSYYLFHVTKSGKLLKKKKKNNIPVTIYRSWIGEYRCVHEEGIICGNSCIGGGLR